MVSTKLQASNYDLWNKMYKKVLFLCLQIGNKIFESKFFFNYFTLFKLHYIYFK